MTLLRPETGVDSDSDTAPRHLQPSWLFPVLLLILLQIAMVWRNPAILENQYLSDPDGYTRLARVEALVESGDWFDKAAVRANSPYGTTLHWTRPFDILLLAGAMPFLPFMTLKGALYWSGALINPLLHIASLIALMWAVTPLLQRQDVPYLGVLMLALPAVHSYFDIGRADHHGLILFLFVVLVGLCLRALLAGRNAKVLIAAGLTGALLMWVSVEALVTIGVVLLALSASWLVRDWPSSVDMAIISGTLWLGLLAGLIVEHPPDNLLSVAYDALSAVHVFIFVLPAVFFVAVHSTEGRFPVWAQLPRRLSLIVLGAVGASLLVAALFPQFFGGPYVDVNPRVVSVWLDKVQEVRALISAERPLRSLREIVFLLGHVIVAIPVLIWLIRTTKGSERQGWVLIAIGVGVFVPLTLYQARWATYAEFVMVIPYAVLMGFALDAIQRQLGAGNARRFLLSVSRALVVVGFTSVFLLLGAGLHRLEASSDFVAKKCPLTPMAIHLGEDPELGSASRRVMAFIFDGPEIVYRSPHAVVATPYQRNTAGILDTYDFFAATEEARARDIVDRRGIELVLLCRHGNESQQYKGKGSGRTVYDRLLSGEAPAWLRPWPLPDHLVGNHTLFEVIR